MLKTALYRAFRSPCPSVSSPWLVFLPLAGKKSRGITNCFLLHSQQLPGSPPSLRPALMLFLRTKEAAPMHLTSRQTTCYTPWVPRRTQAEPRNRQPIPNVTVSLCKTCGNRDSCGEKSGFGLPRSSKSLKVSKSPPPGSPENPRNPKKPKQNRGDPKLNPGETQDSQTAKRASRPRFWRPASLPPSAPCRNPGCHAKLHPKANPARSDASLSNRAELPTLPLPILWVSFLLAGHALTTGCR